MVPEGEWGKTMRKEFVYLMKGQKEITHKDDGNNIELVNEWDDSIKKFKDKIMWGFYQIEKEDEDDDEEKKGYNIFEEKLIKPYYTGPPSRKTPGIFIMKDNFAYYITGPSPVSALKENVESVMYGYHKGPIEST